MVHKCLGCCLEVESIWCQGQIPVEGNNPRKELLTKINFWISSFKFGKIMSLNLYLKSLVTNVVLVPIHNLLKSRHSNLKMPPKFVKFERKDEFADTVQK